MNYGLFSFGCLNNHERILKTNVLNIIISTHLIYIKNNITKATKGKRTLDIYINIEFILEIV